MTSKKPNQERIEQVRTRFQTVESKVLESDKQQYFRLPYETALEAVDADLSKTAYHLWIYLSDNYPFGDCDIDLPSQTELGIRLQVSSQAVNIAAAELQAGGLLPKGVKVRSVNKTEKLIRARLHTELNGLVEVVTSSGKIDLLTDTEIIEVKAIKDWKAALGQVLIYSGFYPQHQKRLHLFGTIGELEALADIEVAVLFEVKVTD